MKFKFHIIKRTTIPSRFGRQKVVLFSLPKDNKKNVYFSNKHSVRDTRKQRRKMKEGDRGREVYNAVVRIVLGKGYPCSRWTKNVFKTYFYALRMYNITRLYTVDETIDVHGKIRDFWVIRNDIITFYASIWVREKTRIRNIVSARTKNRRGKGRLWRIRRYKIITITSRTIRIWR